MSFPVTKVNYTGPIKMSLLTMSGLGREREVKERD